MAEAFRLDGELAVVTGASRPNGIGVAIGEALMDAGATVAFGARTREDADSIALDIHRRNLRAVAVQIDVSDYDSLGNRLDYVHEVTGKLPSILVNNAAVTNDGPSLAVKPNRMMEILAVNLIGANEMTRLFMRGHRSAKSKFGRVVNVGSVVGDVGHGLQLGYAASKAGLANTAKTWAQEWAGVADWADEEAGEQLDFTFNTVVPGYVAGTELTNRIPENMRPELLVRIPTKRAGAPQEIANAVRFLVSREASYVNGTTLRVDGGMV